MKIKILKDQAGRMWLDGREVLAVARKVLPREHGQPARVEYVISFADGGELRLDRTGALLAPV